MDLQLQQRGSTKMLNKSEDFVDKAIYVTCVFIIIIIIEPLNQFYICMAIGSLLQILERLFAAEDNLNSV